MGDYLLNCWYVAAWSDEIGENASLARTILDTPLVFFRDAGGNIRVLLDRCPHRFAPLSRGSVRDGVVTCGYHGLAFNGDGRCTLNPHGPIVPALAVRSFAAIERHKAVWIWMGEEDARPACIPDLGFVDQTPDTAFSKGYVHGNGDYQLFVDNILDLSHADFLHPATLGGGSFTRTRPVIKDEGEAIRVTWPCLNEHPTPLVASRLADPEARVDSWTEVTWRPPSILTLSTETGPVGTPRGAAGQALNLHILTPASAGATHYFFAATRNFSLDDVALNRRIERARQDIFSTEDEPMIKAQQERMGDASFWSLKPVLLPIDRGAVLVRRRLEKLIEAERASTASSASGEA